MLAPSLMVPVHSLAPESAASLVESLGGERFRAQQLLAWIYGKGVADPARMTNLSPVLRDRLGSALAGATVQVERLQESRDGTRKFAIRLDDAKIVESVLIPDRHRLTLCISSQVGCAMACGFCATARLGLERQLRTDEIVGQVVLAREHLVQRPMGDAGLTNLVFMGMGEPLHNLDALLPALEILTSPWGLGISPRRITVSTAGLVPGMRRLLEATQVNLAVSLSATTEQARRDLMPVTRKWSLDELLRTCRELPIPRRKRITFEYVMLDGVNDDEADARRLVRLLHGIRAKVNLIRFNPFAESGFLGSPRERVERFQRLLLDHGVNATIRESRGQDIAAACGQLAARTTAESGPAAASSL